MKNHRKLSITLAVLALAATSISAQSRAPSSAEGWRTYRQSFLPALEVTANGDLREVTDPARMRAIIGRDASVARISHADREAFRERVLGEFDVNHDGRLDERERASIEAGKLPLPARTNEPTPMALTAETES